MAGAYPDAPAPRIAYDKDGSQVYSVSTSNVVAAYSAADATRWNNESSGVIGLGGASLLIIFPVLMDIVGIYIAGSVASVKVSSDTTNGIDGTWTTLSTITTSSQTIAPYYRTDIRTINQNGVKAFKFDAISGIGIYKVHFYGAPSAVGDRVQFWHPTLDQPLSATPAWLDWGNRPRATTASKQFRIKNRSGSLTASAITVSMDVPTEAASPAPTYLSQHDFSLDGVSYSSSVVIPSLAPGAISAPITLRQNLSASAAISVWTQRVNAIVGSWA